MSDVTLDGRQTPFRKRVRETRTQVSFPTLPSLTLLPRAIRLYQARYQHDILKLSFSATSVPWVQQLETGVPVKFTWSQRGVATDWYGYVSFVSRTSSPSRVREMEVYCVGTSFPLKERATRVFQNTTIPEAVREIVEEHGLFFIGDAHSVRFPQLVMAGHSYWEWIQEQAKRIGFAVLVDGTNVYFRDADALIDQQASSVAQFTTGDNTVVPGQGDYLERGIEYLRVSKGELDEGQEHIRATKVVGGVDPITAEPYVSSQSPKDLHNSLRENISDVLFQEYRADQVVHSSGTGESLSSGSAKMSRYTLPAEAKVLGDPRVRPFAPVYFQGTGEITDGYWVVTEAMHLFQAAGEYTITMKVVTDGTGPNQGSSMRGSLPPVFGEVNITEALSRNAELGYASGKRPAVLRTAYPNYATHQGFNRTPSLWIAGQ